MAMIQLFMQHPREPKVFRAGRMSIDSLPPSGQGPAPDAPAPGSAPTDQNAADQDAASKERTRRIFICYPRSTLEEVAEFHKILKQRLDVRGRSYDVFRDLGDNKQERINPGDYWRDILQAKLDSSICCIVVLVPGIFESEECAKEIEYFQSRIKQDKRRFFFPVEFLEVKSRIGALAKKKNAIALAMKDIHHYDFIGGAFEPNRKIYEKKVDDIADAIHQRVDAFDGESPPMQLLGDATEVSPTPSPPAPIPWPYIGAAAIAAVLAGVLAWNFLGGKSTDRDVAGPEPPPAIVAGPPLDVAFEPALPVKLLSEPKVGASAAETLDCETIKAGVCNVVAIRAVQANGTDWYQFELTGGAKRYVAKDRLPVWQELEANADLVKQVQVRKKPTTDAAYVRALAPDSLIASRKFGPHKTGSIDKELWYRIAQADFYVFFSERDNVGALARWTPVEGCLQANKSLRARSAVLDGRDLDEFVHGEPLRGKIQSAEVQDQKWVRYPRHDGSYGYLRWSDVEACPRR